MNITAIILTSNEDKHLARCIDSVRAITSDILVVDSYSTDSTKKIAEQKGATFHRRKWINYATQFNWALTQLKPNTNWVLRIDADEVITDVLAKEILKKIPMVDDSVDGIYVCRRMIFQSQLIKYGGLFPLKVIRLMRYERGECENRWMDEHIKVRGKTIHFSGEIVDDNLNSLTWWTDKHNKYASREAVDLLNLEFNFMHHDTVASLRGLTQPGLKRWVKECVYARLPTGLRSLFYFLYRYFIRLGFLDGRQGLTFHFLQGFWYRYLVDAKILEVKRFAKEKKVDIKIAIAEVLGIYV